MKYSIIIPAYNISAYINDAIESCLAQKHNDFEIIVVNDGSTDDTANVIETYLSDSRIKYVNKENGGLSSARNAGVEVAKGEYIVFLDGDDWLADNALVVLDKYVGPYDVVVFPMYYAFPNGDLKESDYSALLGELSADRFLSVSMRNRIFNIIPAQNKLYRKSFLIDNKISFVHGILHEDNPYFFDVILSAHVIRTIDEPIYYYRQNRIGSITSFCTFRNFDGVLKGIEHILKKSGETNRAVNFFILTLHIFQVANKYRIEQDSDLVLSYYKQLGVKKGIFKRMFCSYFRFNTYVLLCILLLSPNVLKLLLKR